MNSKATAKDFFLYLGVFIGLYVSVINFLYLTFAIIDKMLPLAVDNSYYNMAVDTMRWPIAILIIFFPAFIYISHFVNKELKASPEKKELGIRRGAIIFTLFVSGLTILIDLATLIYRLLGGEDLSLRFFIKVFVILVAALVTFRYYFWEFKRDASAYSQNAKIFVYLASLIVLIVVALGIYQIGSPRTQYNIKLDEQRVQGLQLIQNYINYQKLSLPNALQNDPNYNFVVPTDPSTKQPLEYSKISSNGYELCATFSASSTPDTSRTPAYYPLESNQNWTHPAGHFCFPRTLINNGNPVPVK